MTASPCISICRLDASGQHCMGCGRTLDEISAWPGASDEIKRDIKRTAQARLKAQKRPGFLRWLLTGAR